MRRLSLAVIFSLSLLGTTASASGPCIGYLIPPQSRIGRDEPANIKWEPQRSEYVIGIPKASFFGNPATQTVVLLRDFLGECHVTKLKPNKYGKVLLFSMLLQTSPVMAHRIGHDGREGDFERGSELYYEKLYAPPAELVPFEYREPQGRMEEQVMFDNVRAIQSAARDAVARLRTDTPLSVEPSRTPTP